MCLTPNIFNAQWVQTVVNTCRIARYLYYVDISNKANMQKYR